MTAGSFGELYIVTLFISDGSEKGKDDFPAVVSHTDIQGIIIDQK